MDAPANLTDKLGTFADRFSPRTVATYNNNDITMAKLEGPFHWHKHDETDDFFLSSKERSISSCGIAALPSAPAKYLSFPKALSIGRWHAGRSTFC